MSNANGIAGKNCMDDGGAAAYCCNDTYIETTQIANPDIQKFKDNLAIIAAGTCTRTPPALSSISKRSQSAPYHPNFFTKRDALDPEDQIFVNGLLLQIISNAIDATA